MLRPPPPPPPPRPTENHGTGTTATPTIHPPSIGTKSTPPSPLSSASTFLPLPTTQFSSSAVAIPATFSEGMVDDGYDEVVNTDISSVVIEAMQKKYANRPQLKWTLDSLLGQGHQMGQVVSTLTWMSITLILEQNSNEKIKEMQKLASGNSSHQTTDLTCPIPLDVNGGSAEAAVGMKADVHYIYVCIKDNSERVKDESPLEG
ncbi:UNVERIFIED_CONTAM: hypothetical protein Slati_1094000 [Sesamum latifolium]|uniref:Uncharacterized protein n=1 Tax=Sesamum latifolium TaxID=2727402 RepID=A0AAW2XUC4_9LAMI